MPTYVYECAKCGEELEVWQSFSDESLKKHPACGGKLTKVLQPVGIVFKGSGFHRTDSRSGPKRSRPDKSDDTRDSTTEKSEKSEKSETSEKSEKSAKADSKADSPAGNGAKKSSDTTSSGTTSSGTNSSGTKQPSSPKESSSTASK
jgi:putative FmdB family regulatory protein